MPKFPYEKTSIPFSKTFLKFKNSPILKVGILSESGQMVKVEVYIDTMLEARDTGKWTAVGLNAVHCAISCCDAMLVFHLGIRSMGEDHMQVADLLTRLPQEKVSSEIATLKRIVAKKNLIAYENREFHQSEAIDILKLTERFYNWALSNFLT